MRSNNILRALLFGVAFATSFSFCVAQADEASSLITLTAEDEIEEVVFEESVLSDLVQPSLVRVLQHVEGSVSIPSFAIDPQKKTVAVDATREPTVLEDINRNILGTGFFVTSEGHILTNSHIVSSTASKLVIVDSFIQNAISEATQGEDVQETIDEIFTKEIFDFILENTTFDITNTTLVLYPYAQNDAEEEFDFYSLGAVAETVVVNDVFYKEGIDVALIKIAGNEHPAVSVSSRRIEQGERVYILRSPSAFAIENMYSLDENNPYSVGVTDSIAVREDVIASSSVYELNLDASAWYAGSPVFDTIGEVLGIAAYDASGSLSDEKIPMYVVPLDSLEKALSDESVSFEDSVFHVRAKEALSSVAQGLCDDAEASFAVAYAVQSDFVQVGSFDQYLDACRAADDSYVQEGTGGGFDSFRQKIAGMSIFHWMFVVAGGFLFLILIIFLISRRENKKKDYAPDEHTFDSESIKHARRTPLSEVIPLSRDELDKDTETKDVQGVLTPPKKGEVATRRQMDDISQKEPVAPKKNAGDEKRDVQSKGDFHTATAAFPRKSSLPEDVGDMAQKTNDISDEDKKRLAHLWPGKYGTDKQKSREMFAYPVVASYIKHTRSLGFSDEEIRTELFRAGWKKEDVDNAFKATS